MISLLADCYGFSTLFNNCSSLDIVIQVETFLLTTIITVLVIRIALIDTECKNIREKINDVFDEYGYYGHLLFEEQIETRISDFYKELQKKNKNQTEIYKGNLDKKKVEVLQKQYNSLKQFRQEHIEAIKPISILIIILIIVSLILNLLNLDSYSVIFLSVKISAISTTIYTIYESIDAVLYILTNPFINND
jgi:hypothetical protein